MKYFTVATLLLLASNAHAASTEASTNSLAPKSFFSTLGSYFRETVYKVSHLGSTPKDLIKAELKVPEVYNTKNLVKYDVTDTFCIEKTLETYIQRLFKEKDPKAIEKIIFCPNAPAFLKELSSGKLMANIDPTRLKDLITSLRLRQVTLGGLYSEAFVESNYLQCFHELFSKVYSNDPSKPEYWPCNSENCDVNTINNSFTDFTKSQSPCKAVLKNELEAYADQVSKTANPQGSSKAMNAFELREAIRENLSKGSSLTAGLKATFDKISEANRDAAATKISENLKEIEAIIKHFNSDSTIYAEAVAAASKKLLDDSKPGILLEESVAAADLQDPAAATPTVTEPTKTV